MPLSYTFLVVFGRVSNTFTFGDLLFCLISCLLFVLELWSFLLPVFCFCCVNNLLLDTTKPTNLMSVGYFRLAIIIVLRWESETGSGKITVPRNSWAVFAVFGVFRMLAFRHLL